MKKLTNNDFIQKAKKIHGSKYDYRETKYINYKIKLKIFCKKCKQFFWQIPDKHLHGCGCPYCAGNKQLTKTDFINKAKKIHNNNYNYNFANYINHGTKIKIFCNQCQQFFQQTPNKHLQGCGCPHCANKSRLTTGNNFIKLAKNIHKDKYDYSFIEYKRYDRKIKIFCKKCKQFFWQTPDKHLHGCGCPYCLFSKGEEFIKQWLIEHNVNFIAQKKFKNCKDIRSLPFDFYLSEYNMCIEFQGKQHFEPTYFFQFFKDKNEAIKAFNKNQTHDKIKKEYCKNNNIKLIEFLYSDSKEKIINTLTQLTNKGIH